jgi:hypothetical protein
MSKGNVEKELGFDEVTSLKDLRKRGVGIPMITFARTIEPSKSIASKHSLTSMVKVNELMIDYSYQRQQNKAKVAKIARNFNYDALGVIIVSIRESGDMFVLDGGHRIAAMHLLGKSDENINALVYFDLTQEQEASLFVSLNEDRTKPKRSDIFEAKSLGGDKQANDIKNILNSLNLEIGSNPTTGTVRAVSGVNEIYENAGAEVLYKTMYVISSAFGRQSSVFNKQFMTAISLVYHHFGHLIDDDRMIEKLPALIDPSYAVDIARNSAKMKIYKTVSIALINMIATEYNKRLKKNFINQQDILKINHSRPWDRQ